MRTVLAVPRTVATLVVGLLATIVAAPIATLVASVNARSPVVERVIQAWARTWLAMAGVQLEVEGAEEVDRGRSHVVVANHLSNFDIMVCFAAIPLPIRFLAKKELFKIPLLAQAMRAIGIVEVDRQARSAAIESVNLQASKVRERDHSLIIFPEGTRSRDGRLHTFKKGAFTMAVTTGTPVLPVTLHGTREVWPPERPLIYGGRVRVVIDPAIPTDGLGREDVGALRDRVQGLVAANLETLGAQS